MKSVVAWAIAAGLSTLANAAAQPSAPSGMTVAQILEKNAEARGGAEAWRKIDTMIWVGHVESSNAQAPKLPFMLEQKRPNKTRFEIFADKQKSLRVFDGANGWKMRFTGAGKPEVQAFTVGETSFARDAQVIDGPLIDSAAKGITVILAGVDDIEGHKAYRLDVRLRSGLKERVWIDAESFLDVKWEREGHGPGGRPATVVTYYRDYHSFEGLQIPATIETGASVGGARDKLVIEKIALNPQVAERDFAKPGLPGTRHHGVTVDTRLPPPPPTARQGVRPGS